MIFALAFFAPIIALAVANPIEMLAGAAVLVAGLVVVNWAISGRH